MSGPKDFWDKAEVVGKLLVPVVVGVAVWLWNSERTDSQTSATMTQIAIGVLGKQPNEGETDALRNWAIDVLQNPANPPPLSEEAAAQLRLEPIGWGGGGGDGFGGGPGGATGSGGDSRGRGCGGSSGACSDRDK